MPRNEGHVLILDFKDNTHLQRVSFKYSEERGGGQREKNQMRSALFQSCLHNSEKEKSCDFSFYLRQK